MHDRETIRGGKTAVRTKARRWLLAMAMMLGCSTSTPANTGNYPSRPIELKYYASGPWAVTASPAGACCDSSGNRFDLYYPTKLGAGGFKHPILTWGNGTYAKPDQYDYFLRHMASWGFVVVATEDEYTGPGQTILDAANFMIGENSNAASIFYRKLDVKEIGALGHSQGATGAINALIKSKGSIKTVIAIELPKHFFCSSKLNCTDTKNLTNGSIFFIDGSEDGISPPTQYSWESGEQSIQAYYDAAPSGIAKVKGTLIGPDHLDVQGQPECSNGWIFRRQLGCTFGVYGYLGYPTAWMMAQLQGDTYAAGAFAKGSGEIFSETTNWEYVEGNLVK
jgi:hypothetical protein